MNPGKVIYFVIIAYIFMGCAASYHTIKPEQLSYPATVQSDGVEMGYRYDILSGSGNKKYAKKEWKKSMRLLAVELTNHTNATLHVKDNLSLVSGGRTVALLEPEFIKKEIKQIAPLYLLWSLLWVFITNCDSNDCHVTPLPVGPAIALINVTKAAKANKSLLNNLTEYNLMNMTIQPGETVYGIIGMFAEGGQPLKIELKK